MRSRIFSAFAALSVLIVVGWLSGAEPVAKTASWPQWRGPNRDGHSPEKGLLKNWDDNPPKLMWMSDGLGEGFSSVSIGDSRIYTMGNFEEGQFVLALNLADGKMLWKKAITQVPPKHGYEGSRCTPSIDGDRLYIISSDGTIACLKSADGTIIWSRDFKKDWNGRMMSGWGFSESPLVDGDLVLCTPGSKEAMIVALNKMTGEEVWRSEVPRFSDALTQKGKQTNDGAGYSSIVISHGAGVKQYVQLIGHGVAGVRASDGKLLWGYAGVANNTANIPTPIVTGDYVFASTGYQTGSALLKLNKDGDGVKAEEVYFLEAKTLQNHHGGMILLGDHIYCGHKHNEGYPICVELKTGKVVWGGETRGVGKGSAAITLADGHLIFRYQGGDVALIEATPTEYRLKGSFKPAYISQDGKRPSWAHPVVTGGCLFLREQDKLMVYDLRALN